MTLDERLSNTVRYIVDRSMLWAFVIVLVAACVLGWQYQASNSYLWAAIAVAIVLGEVGAIHKAVEAAQQRNWIAVGAGATVWALCFGYSFVQSLGVAATSQDSGFALRQAKHETFEMAGANLESIKAKLQRLEQGRSVMQPQRSAAEARAIMDRTTAHRWWQTTEECTSTKGPQTRAFCNEYRSAQADLTMWDQITVQDAKIDEARQEVAAAQKSRREAPVTTSQVDPFAKLVNHYTGADIQSVADATAVQKTVTVNSILTLTALMLFAAGHAATGRRNPPSGGRSEPAAPTLPAAHQTPVSAPQNAVPSIVQVTDETLRRWAQSPEVKKLHAA